MTDPNKLLRQKMQEEKGRAGISIRDVLQKGQDLRLVPLSQIVVRPQVRKNINTESDEFKEFQASIKEKGLLQPILLTKIGEDQYRLIAGEKRLRAVELNGDTAIKANIKGENMSEREILALQLIENIQRENLSVIDEAEGYQRLIDEFGLTQEQLAKEVNKTRASITHILAVNRLPEPIRKECANSRISKSALIELAEAQLTEKDKIAIFERMKSGDMGISELRTVKSKTKKGKAKNTITIASKAVKKAVAFSAYLQKIKLQKMAIEERALLKEQLLKQKELIDQRLGEIEQHG